jgi:hypothetical protein
MYCFLIEAGGDGHAEILLWKLLLKAALDTSIPDFHPRISIDDGIFIVTKRR